MEYAVAVEGLRERYVDRSALAGLDLAEVHAPVADRVEELAALARAVATTELRSPRMDISTKGVRSEARRS